MTVLESPLFPNLLYLVLVAGLWLAALAVVTPGTGVLEVMAFFALAGAGFGTTVLPLNGWAVAFLLLGVVLFFMAFRLERSEIWLVLSAIALNIGSVFLFRLPTGGAGVHPLLALVVSVLTLGYFWLALRNTIIAMRAKPTLDPLRVMGKIAEVRTALEPVGSVFVLGELWTARSDIPIQEGSQVKIMGKEGLTLTVEPVESEEDSST